MITPSERLLWGRPERRVRHWSVFVGGFAGIVFVLLLVVVFGDGWGARLAYDLLLPVTFFYAPPVVAALSGVRGGGLLVSLVIGIVPMLLFGAMALIQPVVTGRSPGDGSLWGLALAFGIIGVVGAVVGFAVGRGVQWLLGR
ncbi:hypothetical protein [Haladaptatus sp. NG-SE-30]